LTLLDELTLIWAPDNSIRRGRILNTLSGRHFHGAWLPLFAVLAAVSSVGHVVAQENAADQPGARWAVIIVGISGDEQHEPLFRATAEAWQKWLTESLEVPADHVLRLPAPDGEPITVETIRDALVDLKQKLQPDDSLWVFTLGHGNYDGKHAWLHLKGRDPSETDFARWFADVQCREQVYWLTQSNSGWFVKPVSEPGRIVIAATAADDESNETEFPHALATVFQGPADKVDADQNGEVSVAELYFAVIREAKHRFDTDMRLPTEHAQLDDNGDGKGTELTPPGSAESVENAAPNLPDAKIDGDLANSVRVPWKPLAIQP
jgi:hypothetical protein